MKKWIRGTVAGLIVVGTLTGWFLYQSRTRTLPKPSILKQTSVSNPKPSYVDTLLSKMTLRDKIASLLIMNTKGTDPAGWVIL